MSRWPAPLRLYALATGLAEPLAPLLLSARARRGKEDPGRQAERLGRASAARPEGPLVWIHAASVGESLSHLPIVERLAHERPDVAVLVTSGTRTSAELMAERLPPGAIHQYVPIDAPGAARRFFAHWRPDLALFVESELWPNILRAAKARGARLSLIGARLSEKSARAWARAPTSAKAMLSLFDAIWAQDSFTRETIENLGIEVAGRLDLKRLAGPLPCDDAELARLKAAIAGRPVLLAASTHPGEEALIAAAARGTAPAPLLIIVPRHPERGGEVAAALAAEGWTIARRSQGELPGPQTTAYVADTLGELGLFYRLADAVALGGAFVEGLAGHNPLEPARLGRAVVTGPHVDAFADIYAELTAARAVLIARNADELAVALSALVGEPGMAAALGEHAKAAAEGGREGFEAAWAGLTQLLPPA